MANCPNSLSLLLPIEPSSVGSNQSQLPGLAGLTHLGCIIGPGPPKSDGCSQGPSYANGIANLALAGKALFTGRPLLIGQHGMLSLGRRALLNPEVHAWPIWPPHQGTPSKGGCRTECGQVLALALDKGDVWLPFPLWPDLPFTYM